MSNLIRVVSFKELQKCRKKIFAPSHWLPKHKKEECGSE